MSLLDDGGIAFVVDIPQLQTAILIALVITAYGEDPGSTDGDRNHLESLLADLDLSGLDDEPEEPGA